MSNPERREYVVAVVGATGAVGAVLLDVLAERSFPVSELRPLASERSVGTTVTFRGAPLKVDLAAPDRFDGADLVFFAATGTLSKELGPEVGKELAAERPGKQLAERPRPRARRHGAAVDRVLRAICQRRARL